MSPQNGGNLFKRQYGMFLLLPVLLFLVFNRHSRSTFNNYHSINWADAAGYYVYLPATFYYHFDAKGFPEGIEETIGHGFTLDTLTGKVVTRYTYGVALLQMPFYWGASAISWIKGEPANGYNKYYYRSIMVAAVVYLFLGLLFLKETLSDFVEQKLALLSVMIVLLATNLYYYAINSGGFSHVYSFFLMSLGVYVAFNKRQKGGQSRIIKLALIWAFLTLIRPTNALAFFIFFHKEIGQLLQGKLNSKTILQTSLTGIVILFLVFIPQMVYWNYLSGHWVTYAYGNEGFTHLTNPSVSQVLFSPRNGWLLHSPVCIFMIIGIGYIKEVSKYLFFVFIGLIILLVYLFSSWWLWDMGCGYGYRSMVEWYGVLVIPMALFLKQLSESFNRILRRIVLTLIVLMIALNLNTIYHYDDCWYGSEWDFKEYVKVIGKIG